MTRDEVLDEAMHAVSARGGSSASHHCGPIRALKSKPPEKSPEVDAGSLQPPTCLFLESELTAEEREAYRRIMEKLFRPDAALAELQARYDSLLAQRDREYVEATTLRSRVEELEGLKPELPPYPPEGAGLPRFGLRWNGPKEPLACIMPGGYWTPWHLADALRHERDSLKAQLEATDRRAKEATARGEALTAEVRDHEWKSRGAPMEDEPSTPGASPFDGHPFVPMLGRPTLCSTCGYADVYVSHPVEP